MNNKISNKYLYFIVDPLDSSEIKTNEHKNKYKPSLRLNLIRRGIRRLSQLFVNLKNIVPAAAAAAAAPSDPGGRTVHSVKGGVLVGLNFPEVGTKLSCRNSC